MAVGVKGNGLCCAEFYSFDLKVCFMLYLNSFYQIPDEQMPVGDIKSLSKLRPKPRPKPKPKPKPRPRPSPRTKPW
jgi:hypothetical protein